MTGQKLVVDVATVRQLSNPADINRLLIDAVALERSIDGDLEALLASRAVVDDALVSLKADTSEALRTAKEGAAKLCASTADTAALADKVSRKVRELDAAQSRVRATLSRIETIVDRSRAVEGIQAALERDDLEAAAGCVSRFLEIEDEERKEAGGGEDVASPKPAASPKSAMDDVTGQAAVMAEQRAKLEAAVRSKAAHAVAVKDHAAVARYARLFGPLRLQQEGVDLLVKYLRGLLAERAQADYDALVDGFAAGAKADYIEAVTNLFRDAAAAIDEHLELFRDAFGPGEYIKTHITPVLLCIIFNKPGSGSHGFSEQRYCFHFNHSQIIIATSHASMQTMR